MNLKDDTINLHRILKGKIEIHNKVSLDNSPRIGTEENNNKEGEEKGEGILSMIYTPGVAFISKEISKNEDKVYDYTSKGDNVAIVCDGTRVLGLGNIGPKGAIPVMEGKSVLFKILGNINAYPLCIDIRDKEEIIRFVKAIQPLFGAINIEDIESPKVLEIVERLQKELSIPVFHDDQHGTAIITLSALLNSLKLVNKKISSVKIVIAGAGSAGYGIFRLLKKAGANNIIVTDSTGAINEKRIKEESAAAAAANSGNNSNNKNINNLYKKEIATESNPENLGGSLADVLKKADVFIGVSGKGDLVSQDMVKSMNQDSIVFALSNPEPEILPQDAAKAGARIVATGRSDFPNQINNAVVFPSVFRALLDLRINTLDEDMLVSVATAIANIVDDNTLKDDYIVPKIADPRIIHIVTESLRNAIQMHIDGKMQVQQQQQQ